VTLGPGVGRTWHEGGSGLQEVDPTPCIACGAVLWLVRCNCGETTVCVSKEVVQSGSPAGPLLSEAEVQGRSRTGRVVSCNCWETSDMKEFLERDGQSYDRGATERIGLWPAQGNREMAVRGGIVIVLVIS
jgi:hypothetical protein